MDHLKEAGIGVGIHYPIPLHLQKAYLSLNYSPGDFPVSEKIANEIISLPMFPHLTNSQQTRVADGILGYTSKRQFQGGEVEPIVLAQSGQTA